MQTITRLRVANILRDEKINTAVGVLRNDWIRARKWWRVGLRELRTTRGRGLEQPTWLLILRGENPLAVNCSDLDG